MFFELNGYVKNLVFRMDINYTSGSISEDVGSGAASDAAPGDGVFQNSYVLGGRQRPRRRRQPIESWQVDRYFHQIRVPQLIDEGSGTQRVRLDIQGTHYRYLHGPRQVRFSTRTGSQAAETCLRRDFTFERLDKPWRAFTSSWAPETLARHLGINSSFVLKDHCYVLVRLSRFRDNVRLDRIPNNINLADIVAKEIDKIRVGDVESVLMFIRKYGSHYIHSYVTGNSLYQVFVFNRTNYLQIKDRLKKQGITQISNPELMQYFSPWHAEHMGTIKVASGNRSVSNWTSNKLRNNYYIFTYPSLLKIHGDSKLLGRLNNLLGNEAILEMNMKTLAPAFKDPLKRQWFEEVLDNFLKLWESNL